MADYRVNKFIEQVTARLGYNCSYSDSTECMEKNSLLLSKNGNNLLRIKWAGQVHVQGSRNYIYILENCFGQVQDVHEIEKIAAECGFTLLW